MSETPSRPMKFPYTFSARLAQFPLKWHMDSQWTWKWFAVGILASFPIIYKIHKLANSPGNVRIWEEKRRKEREEAHHH